MSKESQLRHAARIARAEARLKAIEQQQRRKGKLQGRRPVSDPSADLAHAVTRLLFRVIDANIPGAGLTAAFDAEHPPTPPPILDKPATRPGPDRRRRNPAADDVITLKPNKDGVYE